MHIVVDTQGTDREPEEGGCKRDSSIVEQPSHCAQHLSFLNGKSLSTSLLCRSSSVADLFFF